jgi:hypothetical protein
VLHSDQNSKAKSAPDGLHSDNHKKTENLKASQPLVGGGLGWILPVNLNYQHPKGGSDPEVGSYPTAKPLNQGVRRLRMY